MLLKILPLHAKQCALTSGLLLLFYRLCFLGILWGNVSAFQPGAMAVSPYCPGTRSLGLKLPCHRSNTNQGSPLPRQRQEGTSGAGVLRPHFLVPLGRALTNFLAAAPGSSLSLTPCSLESLTPPPSNPSLIPQASAETTCWGHRPPLGHLGLPSAALTPWQATAPQCLAALGRPGPPSSAR